MPEPGNRPYQVEARKKAFAGARAMIEHGKSQDQAAAEFGVNRSTIGEAMLILQHGTAEEIATSESGAIALRTLRDTIFARTTPAERLKKRRPPTQTVLVKSARQIDAEVWQHLRAGLDAILSLPSPKDTATVVRKNPQRIEHVNRSLLAAISWIREFEDEITR